jgi:hypothetical protein
MSLGAGVDHMMKDGVVPSGLELLRIVSVGKAGHDPMHATMCCGFGMVHQSSPPCQDHLGSVQGA